jgi:site-specific recombinase XerC
LRRTPVLRALQALPYRVYERYGVRVYSIGYKLKSGKWAFRYDCPVGDARAIAKLRKKAILQSTRVTNDAPIGGFAGLVNAWFEWQEGLPRDDARKLAQSTITGYRAEADNLIVAWGHFEAREITPKMGYDYLEACVATRPAKGNKEMSLARQILRWGIKKGALETNPLSELEMNKTVKEQRLVTADELELAVKTGRKMGGACHIVALGLKAAYLCVRRSVEVRAITKDGIQAEGMFWKDGKDPTKPAALIEWTDELRATIDEALSVRRFKEAGTMFLFGNMRGQRYTKGGWKKILHNLMTECEKVATAEGTPFSKFSLQDCRPMGVSDKLEKGHDDVQDATLHTDGKMIAKVYDPRKVKRAAPAA